MNQEQTGGPTGRVQAEVAKLGFESRAIHAGYDPDPTTGAVIPPIFATSTYKQDGVGGLRGGYEYSRSGNPTRTALEGALAAVEEGERGFAFASGLAAEDTLVRALTRPGDHAVIPDDAYGGTFRLFDKVEKVWGLDHSPAAVSDVDAMRAAIEPGRTKLVWVETPTNPLLTIGDIEALAAVVNHRHGTPDWMPIQLKLRDDLDEAMASYKHYDLLLVNAMFDGDQRP